MPYSKICNNTIELIQQHHQTQQQTLKHHTNNKYAHKDSTEHSQQHNRKLRPR